MFSTFNPTDVKFSDIRKNAKGGKAVYLNSNAGQKLIYQLPALRAPFGLSDFKDESGKVQSYSLPLSLDKPEIVAALQALDEKALDFISENSAELLGKKMSREVIKEGVYKTLQITEEHFRSLYANTPFEYFLYDSSKLGQVRNFATSPNIQIMVVTVGAINKKDVTNLYKDTEKTGDVLVPCSDLPHKVRHGTLGPKPTLVIHFDRTIGGADAGLPFCCILARSARRRRPPPGNSISTHAPARMSASKR